MSIFGGIFRSYPSRKIAVPARRGTTRGKRRVKKKRTRLQSIYETSHSQAAATPSNTLLPSRSYHIPLDTDDSLVQTPHAVVVGVKKQMIAAISSNIHASRRLQPVVAGLEQWPCRTLVRTRDRRRSSIINGIAASRKTPGREEEDIGVPKLADRRCLDNALVWSAAVVEKCGRASGESDSVGGDGLQDQRRGFVRGHGVAGTAAAESVAVGFVSDVALAVAVFEAGGVDCAAASQRAEERFVALGYVRSQY